MADPVAGKDRADGSIGSADRVARASAARRVLDAIVEYKVLWPIVAAGLAMLVYAIWGIDPSDRDSVKGQLDRVRNPPKLVGTVALNPDRLVVAARNGGSGDMRLMVQALHVETDSFIAESSWSAREIGWDSTSEGPGQVALLPNGAEQQLAGWPIDPRTGQEDGVFYDGTEGTCTFRLEVRFDNREISTGGCPCDKSCSFP